MKEKTWQLWRKEVQQHSWKIEQYRSHSADTTKAVSITVLTLSKQFRLNSANTAKAVLTKQCGHCQGSFHCTCFFSMSAKRYRHWWTKFQLQAIDTIPTFSTAQSRHSHNYHCILSCVGRIISNTYKKFRCSGFNTDLEVSTSQSRQRGKICIICKVWLFFPVSAGGNWYYYGSVNITGPRKGNSPTRFCKLFFFLFLLG